MAKRKRTTHRGQAVRDDQRGLIPGWVWLLLGVAMGLSLAVFLVTAGLWRPQGTPEVPQPRVAATPEGPTELAELAAPPAAPKRSEYDFYTVLPEMEVVIPDSEIEQRVLRREEERQGPYLLQVGSFRQPADAEKAKVELAFLGLVATITPVRINGEDWHRVRLGPFDGVREMDAVKRSVQDAGFQVLVLSERG